MANAYPSLHFPARHQKPRTSGLTVVVDGMDSGYLGPAAQDDLIVTAGDCVDFAKIGWLLGATQRPDELARKIARYRSAGIEAFPGGVFMEMAVDQGVVDQAMDDAWSLGFRWIEVSSSVLISSIATRAELVARAAGRGFHVLGEVGEKGTRTLPDFTEWTHEIEAYVEAGASYVILESERLDDVLREERGGDALSSLPYQGRLIFEVPYGYPFATIAGLAWDLVRLRGADANLANIEPHHVLGVETVRLHACFGGSFCPTSPAPTTAPS